MVPFPRILQLKTHIFTNTCQVQFRKHNTAYQPGYKISNLGASLAFVLIWTHKTLTAPFIIGSLKLHEKRQSYYQFFVGNWINKPCSIHARDEKKHEKFRSQNIKLLDY
jgi:hypothetical protein